MSNRILWLTENFPPRRGGMSQACDRIVSNLRQEGLEIDVAFFSPGCKRSRVIQQLGGRLILVETSENPAHDLNCFWNMLSLNEPSSSYSHVVAFGGYYPILAVPVLKAWLKAKSVVMLRGNDFDLGIFQQQRRMLLTDAINSAEQVCLLSRDQMTKAGGLFPKARLNHIANGIDFSEWQLAEIELAMAREFRISLNAEDRLVIGLIGQLKAKKGVSFFLNCALKAQLQEKLHFLLIGDVEPQLQEWLAQAGESLSITRLPFLDRFELLSRYPACDFIALPSHYDGMPNVLLEAGSLGVVPIAARAGGITEVIPDSLLPLTFHPGDENQCRKALWFATDMSEKERSLAGSKLAKNIQKTYTCKKETGAYAKLFKRY